NYLYREALRPIYLFFDKQDIDEANIRMRKLPDWERMEAARNEGPDTARGRHTSRLPSSSPAPGREIVDAGDRLPGPLGRSRRRLIPTNPAERMRRATRLCLIRSPSSCRSSRIRVTGDRVSPVTP
ncbi:MAG: hypothetical protein ACREXX_05150, partial [Gammaproteobacteria bacterium]